MKHLVTLLSFIFITSSTSYSDFYHKHSHSSYTHESIYQRVNDKETHKERSPEHKEDKDPLEELEAKDRSKKEHHSTFNKQRKMQRVPNNTKDSCPKCKPCEETKEKKEQTSSNNKFKDNPLYEDVHLPKGYKMIKSPYLSKTCFFCPAAFYKEKHCKNGDQVVGEKWGCGFLYLGCQAICATLKHINKPKDATKSSKN